MQESSENKIISRDSTGKRKGKDQNFIEENKLNILTSKRKRQMSQVAVESFITYEDDYKKISYK